MAFLTRLVSVGVMSLSVTTLACAESLTEAWQMALTTDSGLAALHSARVAADDEQHAATRLRFPVVDLNGSYTKMQASPILDIETPAGRLQSPKIWANDQVAMGTAEVSVPLFTSGRISGAIGAARAGFRGADAQETRGIADLKLAVAEAYVGVFRARAAAAVAGAAVASLQAHADDVQVMFDKEVAAQSDLLAAKVALANAKQQQLRASHAVRIAAANYNRLVGQPMDRIPELEEPSAVPNPSGTESLPDLVKSAISQRPEVAALTAQQDAYDAAARAERAQSLPQIGLRVGVTHMDNQILDRQDFAWVGVGFQWRLFDSGQVSARVSALHHRARGANQQLEEIRSRIALEVESAILDRDDAMARCKAAGEAVLQAEENIRVAKELFGGGLGTNTQVLDAESLRVLAVTNRDSAVFDRIIAEYRVQRSLGQL